MGSCAAEGAFGGRGEEMWASGWDWVTEERGKTAALQPPIVDTYLLYLLNILMIINDFSQSPLALLRGSGQRDTAHLTSGRWQLLAAGRWCSHGGASGAHLGLGLFCLGQQDG